MLKSEKGSKIRLDRYFIVSYSKIQPIE